MQRPGRRHPARLVQKLHGKEGKNMKKAMAAALGLTFAIASTAWAQRPAPSVDQLIVRSLNWFSYVASEDIRVGCQPGARSRMRLIYNALWEEQVRTYELFLQPDGTAALNTGVLVDQGTATNVSSILISEFGDVTLSFQSQP